MLPHTGEKTFATFMNFIAHAIFQLEHPRQGLEKQGTELTREDTDKPGL